VHAGESEDSYRRRVATAEEACHHGLLNKVVVARSVTLLPPFGRRFSVANTACELARSQPSSVTFVIGDGHGNAFTGATPETLLRWRAAELTTHAVAGTAWGARADAELLADPTLRAEHAAVVRALIAHLRRDCDSVHVADAPRIMRLGPMAHLETPIRAALREGLDVHRTVAHLHPTPAVCGTPRAAAMRWLRQHEPLSRGFYAGHFGWQDAEGDGLSAVAIRCAMIGPERAVLFAGGGIVKGSQPAREWQETERKLRTVREALRLEARDAC